MKITQMDSPDDRLEFERRLHLLAEGLINQQMQFAAHLSMTELGLRKVRLLPNGRLDFNSVDEFVRLHANTMAQMAEMKESMAEEAERKNEGPVSPPKETKSRKSSEKSAGKVAQPKDVIRKNKQKKKQSDASKKRNRKKN